MTLAHDKPYTADVTITRRMALRDFRQSASSFLKFTTTSLIVFKGQADRLLAGDLEEAMQSLLADEVEIGREFVASSDHTAAISTLSVTNWQALKLRFFAKEHPERVLETVIACRLTRLQFSLPAIDCRWAFDALLPAVDALPT
ncbi:hypothetical protein AAVH_18979 [Aphelenchoides avenae]|nr:hypothetical protein AAVH_18979 [Aphelenchus avenae]